MSIRAKAHEALSLNNFRYPEPPIVGRETALKRPQTSQYIFNPMLIFTPTTGLQVPTEFRWILPMYRIAHDMQMHMVKVKHPFVYLTIKHGRVQSVMASQWQTHGFSMEYTCLPTTHYVWVDSNPVQYLIEPIIFPSDFDPLSYSVNWFIQDYIGYIENRSFPPRVHTMPEYAVCAYSPCFVHRHPWVEGQQNKRTVVQLSFSQMQLINEPYTPNPLLPTTEDVRKMLLVQAGLLPSKPDKAHGLRRWVPEP